MAFLKYSKFRDSYHQSSWETPDRAKRILQEFLTSNDIYVAERTHRLFGNTIVYSTVVTMALTLRASPSADTAAVDKLLEEWPTFGRIYRSGLPRQELWKFFAKVYERVVQNEHISKHVMNLRGSERYGTSIATLLALYIDKAAVYRALENHAKTSYLYIPFDPLRHAYDFFTVILPTTLIDDAVLSCDFDEILRGLRAVGLLFNCDNFDAFCAEFADFTNSVGLDVTSPPGYAGKCVTNRVVDNILMVASKGYVRLPLEIRKLDETTRHVQAVPALIDLCRLMGLTGRDCAFFWFDVICGLSVHPSTRAHVDKYEYRWYGVPWIVISNLNDVALQRKLPIPSRLNNDVIIWFDAKDDARHLLTNDVWCSVQTKATRYTRSFRGKIENFEERERAIHEYRTARWHETFHSLSDASDRSKRVSLQIVEYESEKQNDYLLFTIELPKCPNYLEALVVNMGVYSCFQRPDSFTEELAVQMLSCIFDNITITYPVTSHNPTSNFVRGMKDFLFALTNVRYDCTDEFSLDRVYDVYVQYCREDINTLFAWALRAAAFYHLDEHQYVAFKKLPTGSSKALVKLEQAVMSFVDNNDVDPVFLVLDKALEIYRDQIHVVEGIRKVSLLKTIKHLQDVTIPRAYKYADVHVIDASLPLIVALAT